MRGLRRLAFLAAATAAAGAAILSGCGGDDGDAVDAARPDAAGPDATPRTYCPPASPGPLEAPAIIVFLNFEGGTYYPATIDDAPTNQSSMLTSTATAVPFPGSGLGRTQTIAAIVAHIEALFAPFNIEITTVDPGALPHTEIVMTRDPAAFGFGVRVLGASHRTCEVLTNTIAFVLYPNSFGEVITENIASALFLFTTGLDRTAAPATGCTCQTPDGPCEYQAPCQLEHFASAAALSCGGTVQDEPAYLEDVFGCRPGPEVIVSPVR